MLARGANYNKNYYSKLGKANAWNMLFCSYTIVLEMILADIVKNQYYKYIRIDMIVNQDKLFSIHVTMIRTIWTQNDKIKQIEVI